MTEILPPVLDATCGGRMMWFNKADPRAIYIDNRTVPDIVCCDGRRFQIVPDVVANFTDLPFPNGVFDLVVFDPPHLIRAGENSYMAVKYGKLGGDWKNVLLAGFEECLRVLRPGGTLIFKWCETQIQTSEIITLLPDKPLFGHRSGRLSKTHWMVFLKEKGSTE